MKTSNWLRNTIRPAVLLALTCGSLAINPGIARAGDQVPFRAEWNAAIEMVVNFPLAQISGIGRGQALHLGRITPQSIAEEVNLVTGAGEASYRFTAANGDEVLVHFVFTAVPTSATEFAVSGIWDITGGTGRYLNASGAGIYQGTVEFTDADSAWGHFVMQGTVSSPGSLR